MRLFARRKVQFQIARRSNLLALSAVVLAAAWLAGCGDEDRVAGTFDKTFTVSGPVRLDIAAGSGDVKVSPGAASEVRIHGEFHVHAWDDSGRDRMVESLKSNPPVSQQDNLIRIGQPGGGSHRGSIDYTIVVPAETEIRCAAGSGDVEVEGIKGPETFVSGSGSVTARSITGDLQIRTGSGDMKLDQISGQIQINTGSGDIEIHTVKGAVRIGTGSGDVVISHPGDSIVADTGSGDLEVNDASPDLRLHTSSGDIKVDGNPGGTNYWDLHASSGGVTLNVPQSANFRLYAHTSSGDINPKIPLVMEGTVAKHELRARIGDGKARVEVETSSGDIELE